MTVSPRIALLAACLAAHSAAPASEPLDLPVRQERLHVTYILGSDGSRVETRETAVKVLRQQAVEYAKQMHVSYSTSVERAEVLEAHTRKADGRIIEVPKSNYQLDINKGREDGTPAFSDRTRLTVVFPDVAVGDVVVLKYRVKETEPMFPGHFSVNERFKRMAAYDDVRVRIDAPASLWAQHAATAMTQVLDETRDGRRVLEWTWSNPSPVKSKRRDYSAFNPENEPGYSYSTFRSHGEIAEAYGRRARPKARRRIACERWRSRSPGMPRIRASRRACSTNGSPPTSTTPATASAWVPWFPVTRPSSSTTAWATARTRRRSFRHCSPPEESRAPRLWSTRAACTICRRCPWSRW